MVWGKDKTLSGWGVPQVGLAPQAGLQTGTGQPLRPPKRPAPTMATRVGDNDDNNVDDGDN